MELRVLQQRRVVSFLMLRVAVEAANGIAMLRQSQLTDISLLLFGDLNYCTMWPSVNGGLNNITIKLV